MKALKQESNPTLREPQASIAAFSGGLNKLGVVVLLDVVPGLRWCGSLCWRRGLCEERRVLGSEFCEELLTRNCLVQNSLDAQDFLKDSMLYGWVKWDLEDLLEYVVAERITGQVVDQDLDPCP